MWLVRVVFVARVQRYPPDLSDAEWAVVEPLLPTPASHPRGGRPEKHPRREIVDAILYVVRTGCAWRALPADFPPRETVYWYFTRWEQQRLTFRMVDALRAMVREQAGRDAEPSAGLMDSQSVKGADTVGVDTRGYDAGKKINGRKRFIVTDTLGLLLVVLVLPAGVQDRDGAKRLLLELRHRQIMANTVRRVRHLFADGGFACTLVEWAHTLRTTIEIVRKPSGQRGFAVVPRRWAVERTSAWLTAHRRLAGDYERHPATAEAIIRWAAITTMTRRLTRGHAATRPGPRPLTTR
ncbi:transposase [Actinokineospora auranticolor]|uniref:Transposase n=1 Tax=Actinokineospora auranticolor TaxID=155976 RepID=A0A2S6GB32_9PSEU|nr:transposase [Actinokineospora auranticolor]